MRVESGQNRFPVSSQRTISRRLGQLSKQKFPSRAKTGEREREREKACALSFFEDSNKSSTIAPYSTTRLLSYHQTGSTTTGRGKKCPAFLKTFHLVLLSEDCWPPPSTCYRTGIVQQSKSSVVQLYNSVFPSTVQHQSYKMWRVHSGELIKQDGWMDGHGCRSSSVKAKCRHCPRHCAEK